VRCWRPSRGGKAGGEEEEKEEVVLDRFVGVWRSGTGTGIGIGGKVALWKQQQALAKNN